MRKNYVPKRGDVIRLDFHPQTGREQAGHRPALVLSPDEYNRKVGLVVVCPITGQKKDYPWEVEIPSNPLVYGVVLADQVKNLDWRYDEELDYTLPPTPKLDDEHARRAKRWLAVLAA